MRASSRPQPAAISARYLLGTTIRSRARERRRAQSLERVDAGPAGALEALEVAGEEAVAPRALVGRVGDELGDERPPDRGGAAAAAAYVAVA